MKRNYFNHGLFAKIYRFVSAHFLWCTITLDINLLNDAEEDNYIKHGMISIEFNKGENEMGLPSCPECHSEYTYEDGTMLVCPECGHEWILDVETENVKDQNVIKDANGNILNDGDSVTVIKDLKIKGSSSVVKQGTKVKNIRLVDGDHDIDCKIDGIGAMKLKSEFVKKI